MDWVSDAKSTGRWALAILVLIMFPVALVGSASQVRLYNDSGRQLPLEWTRSYHYGKAEALIGCENGDVIVAGTKWDDEYYWLMRVRPDGSVAWLNAESPYCGEVWFFDFLRLASNRYLLVGVRDVGYEGSRTWLLCIDGLGNELWNQSYGDFGNGLGRSVGVACLDGGAVILSSTDSAAGENLCLLRIDPDGTPLWNVTYLDVWPEIWVSDAASASDGSIVVVESAYTGSSYHYIALCFESTGALRWQQIYSDWFSSVASGSGGNYVLMSSSRALCLDGQGREQWSVSIPLSEPYGELAVVAWRDTYFLLSSFVADSGWAHWAGLLGMLLGTSGEMRWSWIFDGISSSSSVCSMTASDDGGLYVLPYLDTSCLLLRLPNPPVYTGLTALLAEVGYSLVIVAAIITTILVGRYLPPRAPRRQARSNRDPLVFCKASLALQVILFFCWGLLVLLYGPARPYYEPYPGYVNAHTVLLLWLLSPVGVGSSILGIIAFTGLQLGLFPLDWHLSQEERGDILSNAPTTLTCVCVALLIFLGVCAVIWQPFFLMILPFLNGVMLAGFLPKYLLTRRWG